MLKSRMRSERLTIRARASSMSSENRIWAALSKFSADRHRRSAQHPLGLLPGATNHAEHARREEVELENAFVFARSPKGRPVEIGAATNPDRFWKP